MIDLIKMVVVLSILSASSGGLLAYVYTNTADTIEYQKLVNEKAPAIKNILAGATNDPLQDNFKIVDGDTERSFYVGAYDGNANTVVFETFGNGFEAEIGVMVGVNIDNDNIVGIGVTTHKETPGIGSRAKTDPKFAAQFKGLPLNNVFKVKKDGGQIDALSGATISSRGVCIAVTGASNIYTALKPQLQKEIKSFSK